MAGLLVLGMASNPEAVSLKKKSPVFGYTIVRILPHDPQAYTQGLVFHQGFLFEGTGMLGESSLRKVELETGKVLKNHRLPDHFFGEGLTVWKDRLVQLTWQSGVGLVYDLKTFRFLKQFSYATEGWGLTHNGKQLIMSNGTDTLFFLDPESYQVMRRIQVQDQGRPVGYLNELETIQGEIWANVYPSDWVVRIAPDSGRVTGWIDFSGLLTREDRTPSVDVLNGIAYDARTDRIWVTGKNWPKLFEIKIVPLRKGS